MQKAERTGAMECAKALKHEKVSNVFRVWERKERATPGALKVIIKGFDFTARFMENSSEVSNWENGLVRCGILNFSLWGGHDL